MKKEEMIKGFYYLAKYGSDAYIMKFDGDLGDCKSPYIYNGSNFYKTNGSFRFNTDCKVDRLATSLEIVWLEQCIKEQKYVPCPKDVVINSYEIY